MMTRLFVGISIPKEIKEKISLVSQELKDTGVPVVQEENLHCTLSFLGDIENIESAKETLDTIRRSYFKIKLQGIGSFPSLEFINIIWVGSESKELVELMKKSNHKFNITSEFEKIPHITIARVKSPQNKEKIIKIIQKYRYYNFGTMIVDKIILYKSVLTSKGPIYTPIKTLAL